MKDSAFPVALDDIPITKVTWEERNMVIKKAARKRKNPQKTWEQKLHISRRKADTENVRLNL